MAPNVKSMELKEREGDGKHGWFLSKESWLEKEEHGQQIGKPTLTQLFQTDTRYEFVFQDLKHESKFYIFQQSKEREHQRESGGG
jgi:hypothetical protein